MNGVMLCRGDDLKIRRSIVCLIAIDVVDLAARKYATTNQLLRHPSVSKCPSACSWILELGVAVAIDACLKSSPGPLSIALPTTTTIEAHVTHPSPLMREAKDTPKSVAERRIVRASTHTRSGLPHSKELHSIYSAE